MSEIMTRLEDMASTVLAEVSDEYEMVHRWVEDTRPEWKWYATTGVWIAEDGEVADEEAARDMLCDEHGSVAGYFLDGALRIVAKGWRNLDGHEWEVDEYEALLSLGGPNTYLYIGDSGVRFEGYWGGDKVIRHGVDGIGLWTYLEGVAL